MLLWHLCERFEAAAIKHTGSFTSRENDRSVYFTTRPGGQAAGYGDHFVLVDVPATSARLDDEFPSGERHYAVPAPQIISGMIIATGPVAPALDVPPAAGLLLVHHAEQPEQITVFRSLKLARLWVDRQFPGIVQFGRYEPHVTTHGLVLESPATHNEQPTPWSLRKAAS